jgi:hypothetical protein
MAEKQQSKERTVSEFSEVEQPFLQQLTEQGWTVIDQGADIPTPTKASRSRKLARFSQPTRLHIIFFKGARHALAASPSRHQPRTSRNLRRRFP